MSIEITFKEETDLNDPSTDTKFDLTDCCRTCLGLECSLTPTNSLDSDSIKFCDKLAACVSGMKWANEGVPSFICRICIDKLRIAYDFQTVCLQSDQAFQLQEEANKIYTSKDANPEPTTITDLAKCDEAIEKVILTVKHEGMQLQPLPQCVPVPSAIVQLEAIQTLDNPRKGGCKICGKELCEHIALDPTTITGLAEYDKAKEKVILNVKHKEMQLQPFPHCAPVALATVQLKAMQTLDNPRKGGCKVCGKELCEHIALNPTTITGLAGYDEAKEKVILNVKLEEMQLQPFPHCAPVAPATVHLEAMQTLDNPRKGGCKVCGRELCEHIALDPTTITGLAGYDEAKEKVILTVKPEGMQLQPLPHCAPVISATAQLEAMQTLDNPRKGGCKVCGKELCEHIQMYISEPLACSYCDKKFSRKCVLNSHLKTHIGDKLSRDQICNKSFTKSHLTQRMKRRTGKTFRCELCDKTFTRFFSLKVHIRRHSGADRWQCRICNKSHTQSGSLILHMKTHTGEKFLNKLCGQESGHYHHLSSHKWEHARKQPYKCTVCDKVCLNAVQLQAHMIKHTGEKLICSVCDNKFTTRYMLNCHLKSHTGENKLKCSFCDRTFTHSCNLKTHMRTHTGEKPFGCKLCSKKFTQSCSLNLHMKIHTGEKFLCTLCGQDFRHFYQLSVHRREHTGKQPYKCILCGKVCTYAAQFQTHMIKHTGEKLTCSTCDKRFTNRYALNSHLKTHTGENSK